MQIEVVSFHIAELQAEAAEQIPSLPTPTLGTGDAVSTLESGRFSGGRNNNPLQYSC